MRHIDFYLTIVSPWTYMAAGRVQAVAQSHGASLRYKPVDPGALFARTGGLPLGERHESRQAYRLEELRRQSKKMQMPLNIKPAFVPTNPAPAAYAVIAAQEAVEKGGGGDIHALVQSLLRAAWVEEKNVAEDEVLTACLKDAGFDPMLTMTGLLTGAETYGRNLEEAVAAGVFGFPFFVVDGTEHFWGQDRVEDLDLYLSGAL